MIAEHPHGGNNEQPNQNCSYGVTPDEPRSSVCLSGNPIFPLRLGSLLVAEALEHVRKIAPMRSSVHSQTGSMSDMEIYRQLAPRQGRKSFP